MTRARKSAKRKRPRKSRRSVILPRFVPVWVVLRAGLPVAVCFTEKDARFHATTTPVVLVDGRRSPIRVAAGWLNIDSVRVTIRPGRAIETEYEVTYAVAQAPFLRPGYR